jgi:hypothetical protein
MVTADINAGGHSWIPSPSDLEKSQTQADFFGFFNMREIVNINAGDSFLKLSTSKVNPA